MGVDFHQRGKIMEQSLDILTRLWTEDRLTVDFPPYLIKDAVMFPKPVQKPRPPILIGGYVEAVLRRAATKGDGWLTYYYTAESFASNWAKIRGFAEEAGRNPDELQSTNQLPIVVGPRAKVEGPMREWLQTEWDYAAWSESTAESAIMGTVDECVEQLAKHVATGIDRIIFVPYRYQDDQLEIIAKEIVPRLNVTPDPVKRADYRRDARPESAGRRRRRYVGGAERASAALVARRTEQSFPCDDLRRTGRHGTAA